jgi:hypothetical protein
MASRIPERNPNIVSNAQGVQDDDDHLPPLPEPVKVTGEAVEVAGEVRYGKGAQPLWMKYWTHVLVAWALWFAFLGAQGLFHVDDWVNYFFTGVIIAWTIYHLLAPRLKWPALPLG